MRVVLDTDVAVAGMRSPTGASAAILRAARRGEVTLMVSVPLALEYEAVCGREEHCRASGLSLTEAETFVTAVIAMAKPVRIHYLWRPALRDPADEIVLEAAVNGRVEALVTFNVGDYGSTPRRFGVNVLLPRDVLGRLYS